MEEPGLNSTHFKDVAENIDIFKVLLNGISDTVLRINKSGICVLCKDEHGAENKDEKNITDLFPPGIAEKFIEYTKQITKTGNGISFEYNLTDIGLKSYEARLIKYNNNEIIAVIRDITELIKGKSANEFYENIINNVNIDIAVLDHQNRYILVSKSAVKDDATRSWLIGRNDYEYCIDRGKNIDIAESRTEMYNLVDELKKPIEWIEELTDDSGKKRYFVRTLKPLKGQNNERYKVGYGVDITALKVVQNELLRREHLLSFSHKLAKIGYWVWYPINRRHEWSDGVFDILEEDKKNLSPSLQTYLEYIHPEDRANFEQTIKISKTNNSSYSLEYRIVTKKGTVKYIKEQSSSKRSDSNSNEYLFGMVQDITEMKISQDALAQSEEHFRAIAESSPIYIIEICTAYKITYVNNIGNRGREDVIGSSVFNFTIPEYNGILTAALDKVVAFGSIENLQLKGQGQKAAPEWYDVSIGPVKSDTGQVTSIILLAQNITDKKENEQERERLIKEINNRYNELMQFNYIVSHNLRSPIANILGMSYILNPNTPPDDVKQIFEYIMQSAESIDTLIKDLNDVLTARSPLNEKREVFELREIINGVCNNLEQQITASKAFICLDISDEANELNSIKSYVQSIVHNLISNAIKYKSPLRNPEINIKAWKDVVHTHIEVSDNGMGIDLEQHGQHIFGLYKRFTTHNEGKGLGLHMTKAQVESLGGTITIESELDKGCTFRIVF